MAVYYSIIRTDCIISMDCTDALYNSNISEKFYVVLIIDLESMRVYLPPGMFLTSQ